MTIGGTNTAIGDCAISDCEYNHQSASCDYMGAIVSRVRIWLLRCAVCVCLLDGFTLNGFPIQVKLFLQVFYKFTYSALYKGWSLVLRKTRCLASSFIRARLLGVVTLWREALYFDAPLCQDVTLDHSI